MQRKLACSLLAAVFLATLLLPPGSFAGPRDELENIEDRLHDVREKIDAGEEDASILRSSIKELNADLAILQIEINKLDVEVTKVRAKVAEAQANIDRKQAHIDAVEKLATEQAVALYKQGNAEMLDSLFKSESLTEIDERIEMLSVAGGRNTDALIKFHRLKLEIQDDQAELFAIEQELSTILDQQTKLHALKSEREEQLAADLTALNGKLTDLKHQEGDLESAALSITARLQASQALASVANLGESATGFIWPINGAVTSPYGPRWGRMHTGIDIDGVSGQPIVAAKAGKVVLAEYYSGYGNAVIIDHGGGVATLYAHMSSFGVSNGAFVEQGQVVGNVGCTGSCTGDHLHFEVRINGNPTNPLNYLP